MEKWLCMGSAGVAGLLLLLFVLDLVLSIAWPTGFLPFGGLSPFVDVVCIIGSGLLLYLSIDALRELR
jgi:hypothetical protein